MKTLRNIYEDLPEYYPTMYLDGFTPEQVLMAQRKKMLNGLNDSDDITEIIIATKEKIK